MSRSYSSPKNLSIYKWITAGEKPNVMNTKKKWILDIVLNAMCHSCDYFTSKYILYFKASIALICQFQIYFKCWIDASIIHTPGNRPMSSTEWTVPFFTFRSSDWRYYESYLFSVYRIIYSRRYCHIKIIQIEIYKICST